MLIFRRIFLSNFPSKFWTRYEVLTSWTYRVILSKRFEPDMKYWQIEHTKAIPSKSFEPDMKQQTKYIQGKKSCFFSM
jgi:hypothetical protein